MIELKIYPWLGTQQKIVMLPTKWKTTNTSTLYSVTFRKQDLRFLISKGTRIALPDYEPDVIPLGSQAEGKLSTRSQPIQ